jgi:hypothetical protein
MLSAWAGGGMESFLGPKEEGLELPTCLHLEVQLDQGSAFVFTQEGPSLLTTGPVGG